MNEFPEPSTHQTLLRSLWVQRCSGKHALTHPAVTREAPVSIPGWNTHFITFNLLSSVIIWLSKGRVTKPCLRVSGDCATARHFLLAGCAHDWPVKYITLRKHIFTIWAFIRLPVGLSANGKNSSINRIWKKSLKMGFNFQSLFFYFQFSFYFAENIAIFRAVILLELFFTDQEVNPGVEGWTPSSPQTR